MASPRSPTLALAAVRSRGTAALRSPPPLWSFAAALLVAQIVLSAAGAHSVVLSAAAVLAPGLALVPLLPRPLRERPLASVAAAPALGAATTAVAMITLARVGVTLDGLSVRLVLLALIAVALPLWDRPAPDPALNDRPAPDPALNDRPAPERAPPHERPPAASAHPTRTLADAVELLALLATVGLGLVLARRVVGSSTPPGNDWAKYLLYAEQVREHGSLLIRNPFWMLGQPFRDDPGIPALYGSILILARAQAATLIHGILVVAVMEITAVYAFARAYFGARAGILAAALVAVVPASQDILGWYGLANLLALVLLALLFSYLAGFAGPGRDAHAGSRDPGRPTGLDARATVGLAITLLGLLAAHRLSGVIGLAVTALVVAACLLSPHRRRRALRATGALVALTLVGGAGVLADLYARERTFGGSLPYTDYLTTKVDLTLAVRDISPFLAVAGAVALLIVVVRRRGDGALWAPSALLAVAVVLAYAWVAHVSNYYARMVFYVPLALAPMVAAVAVRLRPRLLVAAAAAAAIALTASGSFGEAANIRAYYTFVTPASLRGLDALAARLRPGEVVVTDRCWSFLATWLLHTRTLAALEPQDIEPAAELPFAREAQAIIDATPRGVSVARRLHVRFLVLDPACPSAQGTSLPPPRAGTAVYASAHLAILELGHAHGR